MSRCADELCAGCPLRKETAPRAEKDHFFVEEYLAAEGLPWSSFRPMYLYGPHAAKDSVEWVFDRGVRGRPVPLPGSGDQLTSLTHFADAAGMLAAAAGEPRAVGEAFNCCSDVPVTFRGLVEAAAAAAGAEDVRVVTYPCAGAKAAGFPFRAGHFCATPAKAQVLLGWSAAHHPLDDLPAELARYDAAGRRGAEVDFSADDAHLAEAAAAAAAGGGGALN